MTPRFAPRRLSALAIVAGVLGGGISVPAAAYAATAPDATITAPGNDALQRTGPLTFRGTVQGAVAVRVAVQDRDSKLWWRSDGTWGDQQFQSAMVSGGSWSYGWTPPAAGDYLVQVFAQDAADVLDPTPPYARFSALTLPDRTAPAAAVGSPAQNAVVRAGTPLTARGLAVDDTGVASVGVAIQDRVSRLWWRSDGTWGAFERLPATLDTPGARQTGWTLTWTPPADGDFAFQVVARDTGGTTDPDLPFCSFSADGVAPDAVVSGAQDLAYPTGKAITWSGTATDARGVGDVYAAVQDRTTKQWWHADGTWGAFARFPVTQTGPVGGAPWTASGGRWTFTKTGWRFVWVPPRTGDFGLQVTAVDGAGLADASLPWTRFSATPAPADTTAPHAAFTAPRAGRTLTGSPVRVTGTADDDTAVTTVYVGIMNRDTGLWWQPGGGWGAYRRLSPVVTGQGTASATWAYDWTPPADGRYFVQVEAFDAAGNVASAPAGGRPGVSFATHRGAVAYTTLLLSRSQWAAVDAQCAPVRGAVTLDEVAAELGRRGLRATGTVVGNRTGDTARACQPGFTSYATWADLARLRDANGFTFVSHGATYADMTAFSPDQQKAESCGSLAALEAHGHTRAWGLFAYPNDKRTPQIQQSVVATCFAYGRRYGDGVNTPASTAAPYFQSTWSWPSGNCADPSLTCYSWAGGGDGTRYTSPDTLAAALTGGAGEWSVVQGYKFLRGRRIAASGAQWDCTGTDWRTHWTSAAESYCLSDLLTALDRTHGATFTDPASVAIAWGRTP